MIKRGLLLSVFCFIFICSQSVHAGLQRQLFFTCADGQQIPSNMRCDARKDCKDGSDETFVECYKVNCPELACSYGGCYQESQLCDGKNDCWDGTDEHSEYCTLNTTNTAAIENGSLRRCETNQFKCLSSSECLAIEFVCNGIMDCEDGSDETHKNCLISKCTKETFRCAYGGCLALAKVCDDLVHCWDRSDELAAICSENGNSKDPPLKRIVRDSQKEKMRNSEGCKVPGIIKNLQVKTMFNVLPYQEGTRLADSTVVRLSCQNNTELYGNDLNHCLDGEWQAPWPACVETCRRHFISDTSIEASCQYKNKTATNCNEKSTMMIPGTKAQIYCAPSYVPKNGERSSSARVCTKGPDIAKRPYWSVAPKKENLHCVPECGKIHPAVKQIPWIVSIFTNDIFMRNFSFNCEGYIISPWAVLVENQYADIEDVLRYAIAEGKHRVPYTECDEQDYQLHSVERIYRSGKHAILEMVNPFILSKWVRPVCLLSSRSWIPPISKSKAYLQRNNNNISYLYNVERSIIMHMENINLNKKPNKMLFKN